MQCVDAERKRFKITESMYNLRLTRQEVLNLWCLYNICGSPAERKSIKATESRCHVWLTKQEDLKFRCLYLMSVSRKDSFKVTETMYDVWLPKQEVLKFWCPYVLCGPRKKKVLKLRSLCIMCGFKTFFGDPHMTYRLADQTRSF